jgi:hypothetical protein
MTRHSFAAGLGTKLRAGVLVLTRKARTSLGTIERRKWILGKFFCVGLLDDY